MKEEKSNNEIKNKHYLCPKCLKFPFIKFCKDKKYVRVSCSCFSNEKILIKDLLERNNLISYGNFIEKIFQKDKYKEDKLFCNHEEKYICFSKLFLDNYCRWDYMDKRDKEDIILFDDIEIEFEKMKKLIDINNNNTCFEETNNGRIEILSQEEKDNFKRLVNLIINDYINYPNFSHYFNIKNLLYFFNIEDNQMNEKKEEKLYIKHFRNNEPIIIEYKNNISSKTKLFSKTFIKNNKNNFKIEIGGKRTDLIEEYEFKEKEKRIIVKLFMNEEISEINLYKMFANCIDLISVDGISKLKNLKIISISKMFYNCISLLSIPDFVDWEIEKLNNYLMFYNCFSLIFFSYEKEINFKKYDNAFLGLIITMYINFNKEIKISNIIGDNEGYFNLFGNKYKIKKEEIMIFNGKEEYYLYAFYKDTKIENDDDKYIQIDKKIKNDDDNKMELKLRIINKKIMEQIIIRNDLDLSKWNISNVTNMSYLFSDCNSLISLPDISKWNTSNVTNMSYLFSDCYSLISVPDISKWNTNNVTNMSYLFSNCRSLISLPDISKWKTNNVINMERLFYNCKSLKFLPDISKWNLNNARNLRLFFYNCKSLLSLPDISKWNIINVRNISLLFSGCESLSFLPNISKWNTNNIRNMDLLFSECKSLLSLPDISKWNISNVKDMSLLFSDCKSLISLPDISKWNTNNVTNMESLFCGCESLSSLPDISTWNINDATNISYLFSNCKSLLSLPDISKWNINNVEDMSYLFSNCVSLSSLPVISKWNTSHVKNKNNLFDSCFSLIIDKKIRNNY